MIHLSKTRYCQGVQCPKMLWLLDNKIEEYDDGCMNEAVLANGTNVGELARGLFGAYEEIPYRKDDYPGMIQKTKELIVAGVPVIAEASFQHEGLFCRVDLLRNLGGGAVELYEVKSSTEVKDVYYDDVAFQYYVLSQVGYDVRRAVLVHIDREYIRHGGIELDKLFCQEDVTDEVRAMQDEVRDNILRFDDCLKQTDEPGNGADEHCFTPYGCGFFDYCTGHLPSPNVFDVAGMRKSTKMKLFKDGVTSFKAILKDGHLTANQQYQVRYALDPSLLPHIETKPIRDFLSTLTYPLAFLDFETINPAVPLYDGTSPYQQLPFQYSLHIVDEEGAAPRHLEFLGNPESDPRRTLAERLCADIPENACTVAYNSAFEKRVIDDLAAQFPDLAGDLNHILENFCDIADPFRAKQYYMREMNGSWSIKQVLPALFPDDDELNYGNLEGVHNGVEAPAVYLRLGEMTLEESAKARKALLAYCGLDTLAMVKLWEKLREAVGIGFVHNNKCTENSAVM